MRVLFVGNSYTFYDDMPEQVAALAKSDPGAPELTTERVVEGGATLKLHWDETGARQRIEAGGYTDLVLQEKSTGPLHDAADYHAYVRRLAAPARARGARVHLYETWAREAQSDAYRARWSGGSPAEMLRRVRAELTRAAADLHARIVPVGSAWARALAREPAPVLHDEDLHHASPLGSHLAAAVFYAHLTGRDPTPCPYRAPGVPEDDALLLRSIAWDTVREGQDDR